MEWLADDVSTVDGDPEHEQQRSDVEAGQQQKNTTERAVNRVLRRLSDVHLNDDVEDGPPPSIKTASADEEGDEGVRRHQNE